MANNYRPIITRKEAETLIHVISAGLANSSLKRDEAEFVFRFLNKITEKEMMMRILDKYDKTLPDEIEKEKGVTPSWDRPVEDDEKPNPIFREWDDKTLEDFVDLYKDNRIKREQVDLARREIKVRKHQR